VMALSPGAWLWSTTYGEQRAVAHGAALGWLLVGSRLA
jgi:hypothetical protein